IGLFLVMTVAEYISLPTGDRLFGNDRPHGSGLVVELAPGYQTAPALPEGALVIMHGEAATRWMEAGAVKPKAPLHEVVSMDVSGAARAWFGRMYFPLADAKLRLQDGELLDDAIHNAFDAGGLTFGAYHQHAAEAFRRGQGHSASAAGCSPSAVSRHLGAARELADAASCKAAGKFFCWMSCQAIPKKPKCAWSKMRCRNPKTGKFWPANYIDKKTKKPGHCSDCIVQC
ncbi:hypothetical protein JKP88DRAFT_311797, partial [Tribonema minus]